MARRNRDKDKNKKNKSLTREEYQNIGRPPLTAALWPKLNRKQRKAIIKKAHAKGYSVEGFLAANTPDALKERTRSSIRSQAESTIEAVYRPAEAELESRDKRVRALDEKRKNDNSHYLGWLQNQSEKMRADTAVADQALQERQRQIQSDVTNAYGELNKQAVAAVQGQEGVVSDVKEASALDFSEEGKHATEAVANQRATTTAMIGTREKHAAALSANNFALAAANEARRNADTWKALGEVADEKTKLQFTKGADAAKEIARLLDQEITKAQSNREFDVAVSKLKLDALEERNDQRNADRQFGLEKDKFNQAKREWRHQVRVDRAKLQIDRRKMDQDQNQFDQSLAVEWYNAKNKGRTGRNSGDQKIGDSNQFAFDTAYASLVTATREVPKKVRGKTVRKTVRFSTGYVSANRAMVTNLLVAQLGVNRKVADAAIQAFLDGGGANRDPGNFAGWVRRSRGRRRSSGPTGGNAPGARGQGSRPT